METPPSRVGIRDDVDCAVLISELSMLGHLAVGAQPHEVSERIVALLAAFRLMMDLEVYQRPALLLLRVEPLETRFTNRG